MNCPVLSVLLVFLVINLISADESLIFHKTKATVKDKKSSDELHTENGLHGTNGKVDSVDGVKSQLPVAGHRPNLQHLYEDAKEFDVGFWHALIASFSVIIVSELGDKTFFIAAILAMRHSRTTVFLGAALALFLMTILSVSLGWITQIIPRYVTYYVSTALFAIFGVKMLREGWYMSPNEGQEEFEEAQEEVRKKEDQISRVEAEILLNPSDLESAPGLVKKRRPSALGVMLRFVSKIFIESFTLTFVAEWGDRSQLTTIILASRENVVGVTLGGFAGHALCTGLAVIGGRMIAQRISIRTVTLIGGVVFILFALSALIVNPTDA